MKNRDLPAFPLPSEAAPFEGHSAIDGLTKREYFAAMAMQGFCTFNHVSSELAARHAVEYADALLKELGK